MTTLALSLSVFALLIALTALGAAVAVRRTELEILAALNGSSGSAVTSASVPEFAGRVPTVVVVVQNGCLACMERVGELLRLPRCDSKRVVVLSADTSAQSYVEGSSIESLVDPGLVGRLFVTALPVAIGFASTGAELNRQILGRESDLVDFLNEIDGYVTKPLELEEEES